MSAHTPGPWELWAPVLPTSDFKISAEAGDTVAFATMDTLDRETARANARLIAAAPELLEALKAIDARLEHATAAGVVSWPEWTQVKAAIAKAEGREP